MWKAIDNCNKEIRIHSKLREKAGDSFKIYDIAEIEFDQYHLSVLSINDNPATAEQYLILTCEQLKKYGFEIEV